MKRLTKLILVIAMMTLLVLLAACGDVVSPPEGETNPPETPPSPSAQGAEELVGAVNKVLGGFLDAAEKSISLSQPTDTDSIIKDLIAELEQVDFSVDQFLVDGENDPTTEYLILKNNTLYMRETDNQGLTESGYVKLMQDYVATVQTEGGKTSVDLMNLSELFSQVAATDQPSDFSVLDFSELKKAATLTAEDLIATADGTYELSSSYLTELLEALGLDEKTLTEMGIPKKALQSLKVTLKKTDAVFTITVASRENNEALVTIQIEEIDNADTSGFSLSLVADSTSISCQFLQGKENNKILFNLSSEGTEFDLTVDYQTFTEKEQAAGNVNLSLSMNMTQGETEILSLSASLIANESLAEGEFSLSVNNPESGELHLSAEISASQKDGELDSISISLDCEIAEESVSADLTLYPLKRTTVDAEWLTLSLSYKDQSITGGVTTVSHSDSAAEYRLKLTADGEVMQARISSPSVVNPILNETEQLYLTRLKALDENPEHTAEAIEVVYKKTRMHASLVAQGYSTLSFYTVDPVLDVGFFTDYAISEFQIQYQIRMIVDYENYAYAYAQYTQLIQHATPSLVTQKLNKIDLKAFSSDYYSFSGGFSKTAYLCYLEEFDKYVIYQPPTTNSYVLLDEKPTEKFFGEYHLHELIIREDGNSLSVEVIFDEDDITYDSSCIPSFSCKDCYLKAQAKVSAHELGDTVELRGEDHPDGQALLHHCARCENYVIEINVAGEEPYSCEMLLRPIPQDHVSTLEQIYPEKDLYALQHPEKSLVIAFMYTNKSMSNYRLNIPQIEDACGYRLVGVEKGINIWGDGRVYSFIFPEGMEYVWRNAFNVSRINEFVLPSTLRCLMCGPALYNKTEIVLPEQIDYFEELESKQLTKLVVNCKNLKTFPSINAPNLTELIFNTTSIRDFYMFAPCNITEFQIPDGVTMVYKGTYGNASPTLTKVILPESLLVIDVEAFNSYQRLNEVVFLGNNLTKINSYAFHYCIALKNINLPNSLTEIGPSAFSQCTQFKTKLPTSLVKIGDRAFEKCILLTDEDVIFGDGLQTIGKNAFKGCTELENIRLPASLLSYYGNEFSECELQTLVFEGDYNYVGGISSSFARTVTIMGDVVQGPLPHATNLNLHSAVIEVEDNVYDAERAFKNMKVLNYAGTEEQLRAAGYDPSKIETVNYLVTFDADGNPILSQNTTE